METKEKRTNRRCRALLPNVRTKSYRKVATKHNRDEIIIGSALLPLEVRGNTNLVDHGGGAPRVLVVHFHGGTTSDGIVQIFLATGTDQKLQPVAFELGSATGGVMR